MSSHDVQTSGRFAHFVDCLTFPIIVTNIFLPPSINNNNNNNNNIYLTAIGFSPGGSGFKITYTMIIKDTYTRNLDASKILSGGLHEKHVVSVLNLLVYPTSRL